MTLVSYSRSYELHNVSLPLLCWGGGEINIYFLPPVARLNMWLQTTLESTAAAVLIETCDKIRASNKV